MFFSYTTPEKSDFKSAQMTKWPRYEYYDRRYLQISVQPEIRRNFRGEKMEMWKSLLKTVLKVRCACSTSVNF